MFDIAKSVRDVSDTFPAFHVCFGSVQVLLVTYTLATTSGGHSDSVTSASWLFPAPLREMAIA